MRVAAKARLWVGSGRLLRLAPVLVLAVGMAVEFVLALHLGRQGWFGVDALHYLTRRDPWGSHDQHLFESYAGHWQTSTILLFSTLFAVVGFNYTAFVALSILVHLTVVGTSYLLLVRFGVHRWLALAVAWPLLFFGAGSEAFLADAPMALTLALACGLGAALAVGRDDPTRRADLCATLLLVLGVTISAAGVVMLVVVGVLLCGLRGVRDAARIVGPVLALFVVWYAVFGREDARVSVEGVGYLDVGDFALSALSEPLGNLLGVPGVGGILFLVAVTFVLVDRSATSGLRALAFAGLAGAAAHAVLSSFASLPLGPTAGTVGRYQYLIVVLLLPSLAVVASAVAARVSSQVVPDQLASRFLPIALVVGVLVLVTLHGITDQRRQGLVERASGDRFATWAGGGALASGAGEHVLTEGSAVLLARGTDMGMLATSSLRDHLPKRLLTAQARVDSESQFYVGVGPDSYQQPSPVGIVSDSFTSRILVSRSGCADYTANTLSPRLVIASVDGAQITVTTASGSAEISVLRDGVVGAPRTWPITPGAPTTIATSAREAQLQVDFDLGGTFTICWS